MDFQRFYAGECFDAYHFMGAHPSNEGYVFRVYAPAAERVALIGEFSDWQEIPMQRIYDGQFFETTVDYARDRQLYKYRIYKKDGSYTDHSDPYGFWSERRPGTASMTWRLSYDFQDRAWMKNRSDFRTKPLNIYEMHAGSWSRKFPADELSDPADGWFNYYELADRLIPYLIDHHFDAVEIMPLAEYPADESWGYQETGFYSATSRYGEPAGLQYLVDRCHASGLAVILDVVTVHFAVNEYALFNFDGTALYEYPHPSVGLSEWGSCNFMHSRGDVCSFLQSACAFWLDQYHFDGLRFDAVGNLIYWQGDYNRGENVEAIRFMRRMNRGLKERFPTAMLIAEDSTAYEGTARPVFQGGLGFDYKWNMGWMNDTLHFFSEFPGARGKDIKHLLFSMEYFYNNTYLLPLSHDEVVHGKGTILEKMWGYPEEKMQELKLLYFYMFTHPGKKLNFMGNELAMTREWDEKRQLDWEILEDGAHGAFRMYFDYLGMIYHANSALWERDYEPDSFRWVCRGEYGKAVVAYARHSAGQNLLAVLNFSGEERPFENDILGRGELIFDTHGPDPFAYAGKKRIRLQPYQGLLYKFD